jgi:hypothetical protein
MQRRYGGSPDQGERQMVKIVFVAANRDGLEQANKLRRPKWWLKQTWL